MTAQVSERPRGGIILRILRLGCLGQYTELWTIDPVTLAERAIVVWTTEHKPECGDQLWWHRSHSPGWCPKGQSEPRTFLPRCGRSYDPTI